MTELNHQKYERVVDEQQPLAVSLAKLPAASFYSVLLRIRMLDFQFSELKETVANSQPNSKPPPYCKVNPEAYASFESPAGVEHYASEFWTVTQDYSVLDSKLKICRSCLRTMGYHSLLFQLHQAIRCPLHGEPLVDACPDCETAVGSLDNPLAVYEYQHHGHCRLAHWNVSGVDHDVHQLQAIVEPVLNTISCRLSEIRNELAKFTFPKCIPNVSNKLLVEAIAVDLGLTQDFDWCDNSSTSIQLKVDRFPRTQRKPKAPSTETGNPLDDWRIAGKPISETPWRAAHYPILNYPEFAVVLDQITNWAGDHLSCSESPPGDDLVCPIAFAVAYWFDIWNGPPAASRPPNKRSARLLNDPLLPCAVGKSSHNKEVFRCKWPDGIPRVSRIALGKRDSEILRACIRGSFDCIAKITLHLSKLYQDRNIRQERAFKRIGVGWTDCQLWTPIALPTITPHSDAQNLLVSTEWLFRRMVSYGYELPYPYYQPTVRIAKFNGLHVPKFS